MKSGLLISGSAHGLLLSLILMNGLFVLSESHDLSAKNIDIYIISEAQFDAEVSTPPSVYLDQKVNDEEPFDPSNENVVTKSPDNKMNEINEHSSETLLESQVVDKVTSSALKAEAITFSETEVKLEAILIQTDTDSDKLTENVSDNANKLGNEEMALYASPSLGSPISRNEERVDKIASENKEVDTISDSDSVQVFESAKEIVDKNEAEEKVANKAATTEITPDGIKDAPIIVSGAVANSIIPPPRQEDPADRQSESEVREADQQHINTLLASINEDQIMSRPSKVAQISTMERLKLRKNINQLVGRYWNKGILIGGSDFENYIIEIEILLDRNGNIIGEVRPIQPAIPTGRYAIAFREASNAIKAVGRIPISSEKYQNGLKLKLTFDPASGIGFD